jgi:hypothetical protein
MKKYLPILLIIFLVSIFFKDFIIKGLIPIPADTIVGMYHPWRDVTWDNFQNGVPFKNFLITDPVRQQYPWKFLAIDYLKIGQLPLWNPYTFSGSPLLANFQSGAFYPLNIIFFILPFNTAWGIFILLQFLVGGIFMYLYLKNLRLLTTSALMGAITFIFSGFFIAWSEWGNIVHTLLWLPLILLSIDKIVLNSNQNANSKFKIQNSKLQIKIKNQKPINISHPELVSGSKNAILLWSTILIISVCSSFFAGHLQIFFYVLMMSVLYSLAKIFLISKNRFKIILLFAFCLLLFTVLTTIQWIPTLKFILASARSLDQVNWQQSGWFIPWQHLIQFLAPDFFGNPTTLNYWGIWNYGEFIGYVSILPLILTVYALFSRRDKKTLFFGSMFFVSLLLALPTFIAKLPYVLNVPFLSTSQPTRLMSIIDLSLSILAALGMDYFLRKKEAKPVFKIIFLFFIAYSALWLFVSIGPEWFNTPEWITNLSISKRNLIFPSIVFALSSLIILLVVKIRHKQIQLYIIHFTLLIILVDFFRFGWKFLPFTKEEWIFPKTKTIEFLQEKQKEGRFRIMSTDERIFPPNFSIVYKIETIDGYDPLYLKSYANLISQMENRSPNSSFNRIITPKNYESPIVNKLNVRYVLSLTDLKSAKLRKVFQEGETRVYENLYYIKEPYFINNYEH